MKTSYKLIGNYIVQSFKNNSHFNTAENVNFNLKVNDYDRLFNNLKWYRDAKYNDKLAQVTRKILA